MQAQQSKENYSNTHFWGGEESKEGILDTFLQRHLEYSSFFESKTQIWSSVWLNKGL